MKCFVGIDLHVNNCYIAIIDQQGRVQFKQRYPNHIITILRRLEAWKSDILGIVVESTFNWYWLVDGLQEKGYPVSLANPSACEPYKGLKHSDDKSDAIWLAEMLRLGILPRGYIYPRQERKLRDLLRKRTVLIKHRTSLLSSLKGFIHNWSGRRVSRARIKSLGLEDLREMLDGELNIVSTGCLRRSIQTIEKETARIESVVHQHIDDRTDYKKLTTVWGIGPLLAATIKLETGDVKRFASVGKYASYCRCVDSKRISNERKKGSGNKRNGNPYLAWAYSQAAYHARRWYPQARSWFDRKTAKRGPIVAGKALGHKLARASYFVMRDQVDFRPEKLFA